jgi:hypothetical protein
MTQRLGLLALVLTVTLFPASAQAAPVLFTFEDVAATTDGGLTSLVVSSGGVTMTITRENGATFDAFDPISFPPEFGDRVLSPFSNVGDFAYLVNLSQPTFFFGLDFGDLGPDPDTLTIEAFSGPNQSGVLVASQTFDYPGLNFPAFETVGIGGPNPALSLRFIGGFGSPNMFSSVYVDNIRLETEAIPEPASLLLFAAGLAGAALARRRKH